MTKKIAMKKIAKEQLQKIIEHQDGWDYNRQVEPGIIQRFSDGAEFDLIPMMPHYHKAGEPCEEHLRCVLSREDQVLAFIDMPNAFFQAL